MQTPSILLDAALERHQIHRAVCRALAAQLVCSTCNDLTRRLAAALRAAAGTR